MDVVVRLTREFAYNAWANREALRSLLAAKEGPSRAAEGMAHSVGGECTLSRRLGHTAPELPVWPALSLHECDSPLRALSSVWKEFLASITAELLSREVAYTNTKG